MGSKDNGFRSEEMVILSHYDKREGKWVETSYPKVGGRLRLAHEDNDQMSINTEVIQYDESIAVVKAELETRKGRFSGIGMASMERDQRIAPAILELAETRAIARALRFGGFGVEYCGAEEISHLNNGQESDAGGRQQHDSPCRVEGRQNGGTSSGSNGGDPGRITNKQLSFIVNLGREQGLSSRDLDSEALAQFGVRLNHLSVRDASTFIDVLRGGEGPAH